MLQSWVNFGSFYRLGEEVLFCFTRWRTVRSSLVSFMYVVI